MEQFIAEFKEQNGDLAFVALSIDTYENLAINISELRRSQSTKRDYSPLRKGNETQMKTIKTKLNPKLTETKYGKFIIHR